MTRIPSLNGLRALSILMVLVGHAAMCSGFHSWWLHAYTYAGVLVFFVVSGYLITTLMLRESEQTGTINVRAFYLRRAWRILPVAYAYLLIITLVQHGQFSWSSIVLSWTYLTSYGVSYSDHFPWDLNHLWSLSVEEQFYLLWPLIFAFSWRCGPIEVVSSQSKTVMTRPSISAAPRNSRLRWPRRAAWAAVLIAPIFRYLFIHASFYNAAFFFPPAVMDSIAIGCLIALYAKPLMAFVSRKRWLGVVWLVALASPLLMAVGDRTSFLWPLPQLLGHCAWTIFNACVGLGTLWAIAWQPRILNHWLAVWLGAISYSLYIWHMPFMNPRAGIAFPFNFVLAFMAATVSYYLLEQPVLGLRNLRNNQPIEKQATIG